MKRRLHKQVHRPGEPLAAWSVQPNVESGQGARVSMAVVGLALSLGTAGILVERQGRSPKTAPVATSTQTLSTALAQNTEFKYEQARAAIASGAFDEVRGPIVHEVREDDTLWKLTQMYGVDAAAIAVSNGVSAATELQPGTKLVVPPVSGLVHRVKPGETLGAIAQFYGVSAAEIAKHSQLESPDFLEIDRPLTIPGDLTQLMAVREEHAKARLVAERDRLQQRLQELGGKFVPVSHDPLTAQIQKAPKYTTYRVVLGDTLETIARRYGVQQSAILAANQLADPHWLALDQELKIPMATPAGWETAATNKPAKEIASTLQEVERQIAAKPIPVKAATPLALSVLPIALNETPGTAEALPWGGLVSLAGLEPAAPVAEIPTTDRVTEAAPSPATPTAPESSPIASVAATVLPALVPILPVEQVEKVAPLVASARPSEESTPSPEPVAAAPTLTETAAAVSTVIPAIPAAEAEAPKMAAVLPTSVPAAALKEQLTAAPVPPLLPASAAEPAVKLAAEALLPNLPEAVAEMPSAAATQTIALLPAAEARMTSVELRRLELEVEQLSDRVRAAEQKAREQEQIKLAAAPTTPALGLDGQNRVVVQPSEFSAVSPQLPPLAAANFLPDINDLGVSTGFIWPAQGVLTSGFGWRWGRMHQGIDIAGPVGTPILAAAAGVVEFSGWNDGGYGYMIDIRHSDGTVTRYAHNSALYVRSGQSVGQGQPIAAMGSTGFSTGPHLHFEIRPNGGAAVNPMAFFSGRR
ncbi:MAG: peptidoglycan DD-metalloendopeptidase family protein [Pseudanabaenaceae cyanobacterium]